MKTSVEQTSAGPLFDRVLRLAEVEARVGFKRTKIGEEVDAGRFPEPIALGPRAVGWRESEVQAWIASRPRAPRQNTSLEKARAARRPRGNAVQVAA
jgi:prophage regulatory protein